ncbi:hypothetical protein DL96DRAFT_1116379 [Flagelloscypha sp. PMI_526]|nr:hypothetical protein DL96DRAFT_1116379 [Flagelloscypha sp. PMI_526]
MGFPTFITQLTVVALCFGVGQARRGGGGGSYCVDDCDDDETTRNIAIGCSVGGLVLLCLLVSCCKAQRKKQKALKKAAESGTTPKALEAGQSAIQPLSSSDGKSITVVADHPKSISDATSTTSPSSTTHQEATNLNARTSGPGAPSSANDGHLFYVVLTSPASAVAGQQQGFQENSSSTPSGGTNHWAATDPPSKT